MSITEGMFVEELDRLIHAAALRIEQQRLHVEQSAASHWQVAQAQHGLDAMTAGLRQLRQQRALFG